VTAAAGLVACGSANGTPSTPQQSKAETTGAPSTVTTSATGSSTCTIDGTPFRAAFAKREDDEDDNAVRVFVFSTAPATDTEKKSACERTTPIPGFALKSDKRVIEVDFNDAANLTKNYDVLFLTHTEVDSYNHNQQESGVATLKGSGSAQSIYVRVKSDDSDCELGVPVFACPASPR